tara:strand:- start:159 stop:938 length:780 start_codon:yes stop_codon:yes gene_type:complete
VKYNGESIVASVDSIGKEFVHFFSKDIGDSDSLYLRDVYYIYNDFNRVFHSSWSFEQNLQKMNHRTGTIYTLSGDTINFLDIQFNNDMINPELFIKTGINQSEFIPLLHIEKIKTDYSILEYSIERGFFYSFYTFLIGATLDIRIKWDKDRRLIPQVWDQYNDLLPKASFIGLYEKGVTYESISYIIPISVLTSMIYDLWKQKQSFYFTPVYEEGIFGRNMYVFSLKHIASTYAQRMLFRIEKTKFGNNVFRWIRKNSL